MNQRAGAGELDDRLVAEITTKDVDAWIFGLKNAPQSKDKHRRLLHNFFGYCAGRGYADENPVARAAKVKVIRKAPGILTPEDTAALLAAVWLVIGYVVHHLMWRDALTAFGLGLITMLRVLVLIGLLAAAVALYFTSESGKQLIAFGRDAVRETKKVVWPTRKEAMQMTGYVFAFVFVMALFLWLTDKTLEWALYDLILGWKR